MLIILSYPSSPKPKEKFGAYFGKLREDSESSEWREWSNHSIFYLPQLYALFILIKVTFAFYIILLSELFLCRTTGGRLKTE